MSTLATLDPDTGALRVSWRGWLALRADQGQWGADREALAALADVGALHDGELAPALGRAMQAVREPLARFRLVRRGVDAAGWLDADAGVVLVPRGPDLFEPTLASVAFLCDLVGRLVDLGPRTLSERPPVRTSPAELASAIASEDRPAANTNLPAVRDHWEFELRGPSKEGPLARIEVLDTDQGWWQTSPSGQAVTASPCSATSVWRQLSLAVDWAVSGERTQ